jgi:hypothetical protein
MQPLYWLTFTECISNVKYVWLTPSMEAKFLFPSWYKNEVFIRPPPSCLSGTVTLPF